MSNSLIRSATSQPSAYPAALITFVDPFAMLTNQRKKERKKERERAIFYYFILERWLPVLPLRNFS